MSGPVALSVCQSCLLALANGSSSVELTEEELAALSLGVVAWGRDGFHLAADGEELGFRWSSECDVCGSLLGGDRFRAWALPVCDPPELTV